MSRVLRCHVGAAARGVREKREIYKEPISARHSAPRGPTLPPHPSRNVLRCPVHGATARRHAPAVAAHAGHPSTMLQSRGNKRYISPGDAPTPREAAMAARRRRHLRSACQNSPEGDAVAGERMCGRAAAVRRLRGRANVLSAPRPAATAGNAGRAWRRRASDIRDGAHPIERVGGGGEEDQPARWRDVLARPHRGRRLTS